MGYYSHAFDELHIAATRSGLNTSVKYKRVAAYLSRFHMLGQGKRFDKPGFHGGWKGKCTDEDKAWCVDRVVKLSPREWTKVRDHMMVLAKASTASIEWKQSRRGWVHELDTLYAFEHPD